MYCKKCDYNLRMFARHACPECGRPFDPADPSTFNVYPPETTAAEARWLGGNMLWLSGLAGGFWALAFVFFLLMAIVAPALAQAMDQHLPNHPTFNQCTALATHSAFWATPVLITWTIVVFTAWILPRRPAPPPEQEAVAD